MNLNKNKNVNKFLESKIKFGYKHVIIGFFVILSAVIATFLYFNYEINNLMITSSISSSITSIFYLFNKKNSIINTPISSLYKEPIFNEDNGSNNNNDNNNENLNNIKINNNNVNNRRILSIKTDLNTGEETQTYKGQVPLISCPKG
jgi:hypothetical protein